MENGTKKWGFQGNEKLNASAISVRGVFNMLMSHLNKEDKRPLLRLCRADPTDFHCFRTTPIAADAVATSVESFNFNYYPPTVGLLDAKRAIAEHLSTDLPYQLSPDDAFLTLGCTQAINIIISVLARPGANILLPRPGYPQYEARAACSRLEVRYFDLLPEKGWEVDFDSLEALADENTVAMVLINPSNPCGNVFTYQHLKKVAETARRLGIFVISDEVYAHITFGSTPFVPMGVFASTVPVITLGSLSKRWNVPGWRLGWIVTCDPDGIFQRTGLVQSVKNYLDITTDPPTFVQASLPQILGKTKEDFFSLNLKILREAANIFYDGCKEIPCLTCPHKPEGTMTVASLPQILGKTKEDFFSLNLKILREAANIFYDGCKEIPCLTCPHKPEGTMTVMVQIDFAQIEGIIDDVDFCVKLAKEESVILLPGVTVGLKNWLRITFAAEPSALEDGLRRIKDFSLRHAKMP